MNNTNYNAHSDKIYKTISQDKNTMVEMMAYTLAGIALYFASDWILLQIENSAGRRFENRNLLFFVIILILALSSFTVIRLISL